MSEIDLSKQWRHYRRFLALALRKVRCCALTVQYIICSTVGRSIASIFDLGFAPRSYISAMDLRTRLYILCTTYVRVDLDCSVTGTVDAAVCCEPLRPVQELAPKEHTTNRLPPD